MIPIVNLKVILTKQVFIVFFLSMVLSSIGLEDSLPDELGDNRRTEFENFTEIVTKKGYKVEQHTVTTEDGYIIIMFRMKNNTFNGLNCTPVFIFHGVLMSSDSFLDLGDPSLPYTLADAGYDVWAGNARGNYYARNHTTLSPDTDPEFWRFSTDEIGKYDVRAQLDHVLLITGHEKLNIVAFSQGAECVLITLCERPEYNDKVGVNIALAPTARLLHATSPLFRLSVDTLFVADTLAPGIKNYTGEILPRGVVLQPLLQLVCGLSVLDIPQEACADFFYLLDSYHPGSITPETTKRIYKHFPAGTSLQLLIKFGQSTKSHYFQKFDYGKDNFKIYGTSYPARYDPAKVTSPIVLVHGDYNDGVLNTTDLRWLADQLPNVVEYKIVDSILFNHFDHMYGKDTPRLVFPTIFKYLSTYSVYSPN